MTNIYVERALPTDPDVQSLLVALSAELKQLTGSSGESSFNEEDVLQPRSVLLLARTELEAVGCGSLRPMTEDVCEMKRMYAKYRRQGIGGLLLRELEGYARSFGYRAAWLETRKVNSHAVAFYIAHGYRIRANYGRYVGRDDAVCLEKELGAERRNER